MHTLLSFILSSDADLVVYSLEALLVVTFLLLAVGFTCIVGQIRESRRDRGANFRRVR